VSSPSIEIVVERDPVLPGVDMDGDVNDFTVIDNGIGFNEGNLDSFFTSDTQYKLSRGGKGIGRFIWLKAFKYAEIESHYRESGKLVKRAFKFTKAFLQNSYIFYSQQITRYITRKLNASDCNGWPYGSYDALYSVRCLRAIPYG